MKAPWFCPSYLGPPELAIAVLRCFIAAITRYLRRRARKRKFKILRVIGRRLDPHVHRFRLEDHVDVSELARLLTIPGVVFARNAWNRGSWQ